MANTMQLKNPLQFPLVMLVSGVVLIFGVRVARLPSVVMLPLAGAIAVGGTMVLGKPKASPSPNKNLEPLQQELQAVVNQAEQLNQKAGQLRQEAAELLAGSTQVDLLGVVQYACDRATELPQKLQHLSAQLNNREVLLSVKELQQQMLQVHQKMSQSSGMAQQQLRSLADRLQRNIQLAQQGEDARQAQILSLSALILDASAVLQQLQTKLRTADLSSTDQATELRSLSDEFTQYQENVDLLLS